MSIQNLYLNLDKCIDRLQLCLHNALQTNLCSLYAPAAASELCSSLCRAAASTGLPRRATGLLVQKRSMSSQLGHVSVCTICLLKSVLVYRALQKCKLLVLQAQEIAASQTNFREKQVFLNKQVRYL